VAGVAACARYAREAWGLSPVLLAPPAAIRAYEDFGSELGRRGECVPVRMTRDLGALVDNIASSSAVLTADTATAHLAAALDKPMVCVISGAHYGIFGPWQRSQRQAWLTHHVPCFQCNYLCVHDEPICITRVPAQEMSAALDRVLRAAELAPVPA
jgi:ADP-heptose:LPS heptosyltransferase